MVRGWGQQTESNLSQSTIGLKNKGDGKTKRLEAMFFLYSTDEHSNKETVGKPILLSTQGRSQLQSGNFQWPDWPKAIIKALGACSLQRHLPIAQHHDRGRSMTQQPTQSAKDGLQNMSDTVASMKTLLHGMCSIRI